MWRWLLLVDPWVFWAPQGLGVLTCGSVHRPDAQLWLSTRNSARNSLMTHSNIEFTSLELQRFWGISKNDRDKLRAKFGWQWCHRRPRVPQSGPLVPPAPSTPVAVGVLQH